MNDETRQILAEIRKRQANPLNLCCVRCRNLIYPHTSHLCPADLARMRDGAPGWA